MHVIFFAWLGDYDSLCSTYFFAGARTRSVPINGKGYFGIIESSTGARTHYAKLHPNFTVLPGPHGTVNAAQAAVLAELGIQTKEGDPFSVALGWMHSNVPEPEAFDVNAY